MLGDGRCFFFGDEDVAVFVRMTLRTGGHALDERPAVIFDQEILQAVFARGCPANDENFHVIRPFLICSFMKISLAVTG